MVSHARTAAQRREQQRRRAEARFAGRLCKMAELRHRGFAPSHALMRVMADLMESVPQERVSEHIVEQTVDNPKHHLPSPEGGGREKARRPCPPLLVQRLLQ